MRIPLLKKLDGKEIIGIGIVMLAALWINVYFSLSETYWLSFSAFFAWQISEGAPFRQAIILFLIICSAMLIVFGLQFTHINKYGMMSILALVYVLSAHALFISHFLAPHKMFFIFLFLVVWLITGLSPFLEPIVLENMFLDILIGTIIGAMGKIFIFSAKPEDKFRLNIVPVLKTLETCTSRLCTYFLHPQEENTVWKKEQDFIQNALQTQQGKYLEWVFDAGFNPKLRGGFRFFLLHLEWIIEIILSLSYLISRPIEPNLLKNMQHDLYQTMQNNLALITFLLQYFEHKTIETGAGEFKNDLIHLKESLQQNIPVNIELLDISPDYIHLTAMAAEIKDLRGLLLELVLALPQEK